MKLIVEQGAHAGQTFTPEAEVILGRGGEMSLTRIALAEQGASRQHARIQRTQQGWVLTDLGSTNGTVVNGHRLRAQEPYALQSGDRFAIGGAVFRVQVEDLQVPSLERGPAKRRLHPAVLSGLAFLIVMVIVALVAALVLLLQPQQAAATPTPGDPVEAIVTALPVPTEFEQVVTSVVPLLSTVIPMPDLGPTATPEALAPGVQRADMSPSIGPSQVSLGAVSPSQRDAP